MGELMSSKVEIKENMVFYPKNAVSSRHPFRRVVGVIDDRIFYSCGDRILNCNRKSFLKTVTTKEPL